MAKANDKNAVAEDSPISTGMILEYGNTAYDVYANPDLKHIPYYILNSRGGHYPLIKTAGTVKNCPIFVLSRKGRSLAKYRFTGTTFIRLG